MFFTRFLVFSLIVVFPATYSLSQPIIYLESPEEIERIGNKTVYLEDPTLQLSIRDILQDHHQAKFSPCRQDAPNFSSTASAYWLKFEVQKEIKKDFYLEIGTAFMDSISLFELNSAGDLISVRYSGDDLPFNSREVKIGNYLFVLNFPVGIRRTYYLRIKSDQPLFFPLRVGTLVAFMEYSHDQDFLQGIYFGFMLLIFFYNLFLYFTTKEKVYLHYIAYVFSITWFMASVFGYFFEYLWPNAPWINQNVVISSGLTLITATLFTQKFLDTKTVSARLHRGTRLFTLAGVLVIALVIFDFKIIGLQLAQAGLLFMAIYFLVLGIRFKLKGFGPAKFYLVAWGTLVVGIIFAILESLNQIPLMPYVNAMQIGSGLEVLLLSFALGDKINTYKKQKEDAMALALATATENEKLVQEQKTILEQKVTERTEKITRQNDELVNLNTEKDTLIAVVAHDLRSPLNQIKGFIQLITLSGSNLSKDQEEFLNQMHHSADRLTQMISRILDINAIESKKIHLKIETVDLVEVVEYVMKYYQSSADEKKIEVVMEANEGDHFAEVDKNYMIQILENLFSNAIKFSNQGSLVHLRVITNQKQTKIEVEDQGPGISQEDQKKLFERYRRLTAKPTAGEESRGLGLSIVKKYIEAMHGKITVHSAVGKGTKFTVSFDAVEVEQSGPVS